ncbi:MAG TPA: hypothetical protein PKM25_18560, partial [Candidatus Ozemobacteraceae bacterium]|nr:hypothetical protein [Candidatus Ozemobacteraceae bacterium]
KSSMGMTWIALALAPAAFFSPGIIAATLPVSPDECMVIGDEANPIKGTKLYLDAVSAWRQGLKNKALDIYEEALLADRGVLSRHDEGLAQALLERYRERVSVATPTTGLLCRQGFFENVISGNLESSIAEYKKAASMAVATMTKAIAEREVGRLQKELEYIRSWQIEYRRKIALQRRHDDAEIDFQSSVDSVDGRIEALQDEKAALEERLAYLRHQEGDGREELMTSIQRASRYRRAYYYPGRQYQSNSTVASYAGPVVGPLPSPPPGEPGPLTPDQINPPGPLPDTQNSPTQTGGDYQIPEDGSSLSLYYRNRNETMQNESALKSIRAEISGMERRIEQIEKLIEKTEKERDRLFNPPVPAAATLSAPIPGAVIRD